MTIKFTATSAKEIKEKLESFKNLFGKAVLRVHGLVTGNVGNFSRKYAHNLGEVGEIATMATQTFSFTIPSGPDQGYNMSVNPKTGCKKAYFTISGE